MVGYPNGKPSPKLLRLQELQLELASRFVDYCRDAGLQPFLAAGSALGAWRDGRMIEWDDDIDFGMIRPEYEALLASLVAKPMPGVTLQCSRTTPDYPYTFAKLRLDGTKVSEHLSLGNRFHDGIFIDVFPYDAVPLSYAGRKVHHFILAFCNFFVLSFNRQLAMGATRPLFRRLRLAAMTIRPFLPINAIAALREWTLRKTWSNTAECVASFHMYGLRDAARTEIGLTSLMPPQFVQFGNTEMPVPADCDAYLRGIFKDYRQLPNPELRWPSHIHDADFGDLG